MNEEFAYLFHKSSKDPEKGHPSVPSESSNWPASWKQIEYKDYRRLPYISLPTPSTLDANLSETIKSRASRYDYSEISLTEKELGGLLFFGCGEMRALPHFSFRAYPSGGALYPIEVYPLVLHGNPKIRDGLYHYNVKEHGLDVLWRRQFSKNDLSELFIYPWVYKASVIFFFTAIFKRNMQKYGERGYRMTLLEAGHIGQNIYLISEALGLRCSSLAGTLDENIEKLLDIDGETESLVYTVVVGK